VEGLITLVCREPGHQGEPAAVSNSITVVEREWCYCPSGEETGHTWERIDGTTVEAIRRAPRPTEMRT
jgi:hypothetical protein